MTNTAQIQSIEELIEQKNKKLDRTSSPLWRDLLKKHIEDLQQVKELHSTEIAELGEHCKILFIAEQKLKLMLLLHGVSEAEIDYYSIMENQDLERLAKRAVLLGEYKTPQHLQTKKSTAHANDTEI